MNLEACVSAKPVSLGENLKEIGNILGNIEIEVENILYKITPINAMNTSGEGGDEGLISRTNNLITRLNKVLETTREINSKL